MVDGLRKAGLEIADIVPGSPKGAGATPA
jgi:hypothetical protein